MTRRDAPGCCAPPVAAGPGARCPVRLHADRHRRPRALGHAGQQSVRRRHRPGRRALLLRPGQPADPPASIWRTRRTRDVAGSGERGYAGDGGPATAGSLNMPHEIAFDSARAPVHRRAGQPRRSQGGRRHRPALDGGRHRHARLLGRRRARRAGAALRQPHSVAIAPDGRLLICDVGNHRLRAVDLGTGTIATIGGTGERRPTPDGATLAGCAARWTARGRGGRRRHDLPGAA